MTLKEVKDTLPHLIEDELLYISSRIVIPVEDFVERFEEAELTYESLSAHENTTEAWQVYFDDWKEKGILN